MTDHDASAVKMVQAVAQQEVLKHGLESAAYLALYDFRRAKIFALLSAAWLPMAIDPTERTAELTGKMLDRVRDMLEDSAS